MNVFLENNHESEVLSISKSFYSHDYEVKISRFDFLKDLKKEKHFKNRLTNYFSYVCLKGVCNISDIKNSKYGFIEVEILNEKITFNTIRKARLLNRKKVDDKRLVYFLTKLYHKRFCLNTDAIDRRIIFNQN